MNHSSSSDYLDAVMEAGFQPVESDELPNDLAWLAKSSADAYREGTETVTIVYEDDTVVEVRALTRTGLILTEARFDQTERGLQRLQQLEGPDLTNQDFQNVARLGAPFKIVDNDLRPFRLEVARRIAALNTAIGWPADASIAAADRARVRTQVAREFFLTEHGSRAGQRLGARGTDRQGLQATNTDSCWL